MIPWPIMIKGWLISLSLTLVLELTYAWIWGVRNRHDLILVSSVNILTNPVVVFVVYFLHFRDVSVQYGWVTAVMEVGAVVTEALLYKKFARSISRPWLFSLSANAFSYAAGELINKL